MIGTATACRALVWLAALVWSASALAEVTLETDVAKVQSTLGAGGRVTRELVPVEEVVPGEELRYTITFTNESQTPVDAERIIISNPIPDGTRYVAGTAGGEDARVEYSIDGETFSAAEPVAAGANARPGTQALPGEAPPDGGGTGVRILRWTYQETLAPGASAEVFFHVRMR